MKLGIVDYGVGNIFSLKKAFEHIGVDTVVTKEEAVLDGCSGIILPGVGAFCDAAANLEADGLGSVIKEQAAKGKPILGICLGMQLLFDYSTEGGLLKGLGLINGQVERLPEDVKVPHMGWNTLTLRNNCRLFKGISDGEYVYYVHSYYARVEDNLEICAVTRYGIDIAAAVQRENVMGMQFHPEKSGETGLKILNNFKEMLI
ncbi:MAG TPA: imidazole glycerol phosphate synthase subunit HisH [Negativicutes bacterium]|nr:imidazole glycerol phosphate synthase subunit HisH [Negativicutes bacterium]